MLLNVNYKIFDINVYYEVTASNPSSVVTKKNTIYVSIIMNLHVGTVVRIYREEYQTSISISYITISEIIEFCRQW